jgi:hypothetical protein
VHCLTFANTAVTTIVGVQFASPSARTVNFKLSGKAIAKQMAAELAAGLFKEHQMVYCRKSRALTRVQYCQMELKAD